MLPPKVNSYTSVNINIYRKYNVSSSKITHNGELALGASKTRLKRPWVMQMIVHGFPSKLAALQFEWAWQHPYKSRHMRDCNTGIFGTAPHKTLQKNILIVRTMISMPPFNTWPLHVKLFTREADQHWKASVTNDLAPPLPPGFTCTLELEGVDGKSGHVGSGRKGPISVNDEEFRSTILAKTTAIAVGGNLECTICRQPILNFAVSPLTTALCPSSSCHAVSHLKCLSQDFISQENQPTTMVPRGGDCQSCKEYTLWGDVIRGCYRRMPSEAAIPLLKTKSSLRRKKGARRRKSSKEKGKHKLRSSSTSKCRQNATLIASSESEDISRPVKRKPGRPRKVLAVLSPPMKRQPSSQGSGKRKQPANSAPATQGQNFDSSENEDNATPMKRKRGRPRKNLAILSLGASSLVSSSQPFRAPRKSKMSVSRVKPKLSSKGNQSSSSLLTSDGETFHFNALVTSLGSEAIPIPMKRKRGRPPKDMSLFSPGLTSPIEFARPLMPVDICTKKAKAVTPISCRDLKGKHKRGFRPISLMSSSEDDLNNLVASPKPKYPSVSIERQRGRPRKTPAIIFPPGPSSKRKKEELSNVVSRTADKA